MKPPFKLPVRMDGHCLVDAEQELVSTMYDALPKEREYIIQAVNNHRKLCRILFDLLQCVKVDTLKESEAICVRDARNLLKELK